MSNDLVSVGRILTQKQAQGGEAILLHPVGDRNAVVEPWIL